MISLRREGANHVTSKGGKTESSRCQGPEAWHVQERGWSAGSKERQTGGGLDKSHHSQCAHRKLLKDVKPHNVTPLFIF